MSVYGKVKMKAYAGVTKLKRIYLGVSKIYSAGSMVTYCVDEETTYQEEVDSGSSCLAPTTFIPMKEGWNFVGWRLDDVASEDVLDTKIMEDEPVTVYAVFSNILRVVYDGNGAEGDAPATFVTQHFNNGNTTSPIIELEKNTFSKEGNTFACWKIGDAYYTEGAEVAITGDATVSAEWVQTVKEYGCTGTVQKFVAPTTGLYELEAYGAQGDKGNTSTKYAGGLGGYSKGEVYLRKDEEIYVVCGDGGNAQGHAANFNGGGSVSPNKDGQHSGGAGGGATHFAKVSGELAALVNQVSKILMVAGGGGGAGVKGKGGAGGGLNGGFGYQADDASVNTLASGGGQSGDSAFFGKGASSSIANNAGGGGGYYGGKTGSDVNGATGAGGGSGYIGGVYNGVTQGGKHTGTGKAVAKLKEAGAFKITFKDAEPLREVVSNNSTAYFMTYDTHGAGWKVSNSTESSAVSKMRLFNPGDKEYSLVLQTSGKKYKFDINAETAGTYNMVVDGKKTSKGGNVNFFVNGEKINENQIDFYSSNSSTVSISLGTVTLKAGINEVTVAPIGPSQGANCQPSLTGFTFTVASGGE